MSGTPVASAQREFPQGFPSPGHVTHDPEDIWSSQLAVARDVVARGRRCRERRRHRHHQPARDDGRVGSGDGPAGRPGDRVAEPDHRPVLRAAASRRPRGRSSASAPACRSTPTSRGPKIRAHPRGRADLRARAERGELAFGTVDTFLLVAADRRPASTRPTSRTPPARCCSTSTRLDWDDELLRLMEVPRAMLPEVRPSSAVWAETDADALRPADPDRGRRGRPAGGDVRPGVLRAGQAKNTYGTGAFLLVNIGRGAGRVARTGCCRPCCGASARTGRPPTRSRAPCSSPGAAVQWLRDGLQAVSQRRGGRGADARGRGHRRRLPRAGVRRAWARRTGTRDARGLLIGLTRGTGLPEIARATIESIAYQVRDVVEAMAPTAARR